MDDFQWSALAQEQRTNSEVSKRKSKLSSERGGLLLYWNSELFESLNVIRRSGFCIKEVL